MRLSAPFWKLCRIVLLAAPLGFAVPSLSESATAPRARSNSEFACDACKVILLDPGSAEKSALDAQIAQTQAQVKSNLNVEPQIERLGWLFVQKARLSSDPGFYKLAEQCALCLESVRSNSPAALLLKGHVLHSLHRFKEAEPIALHLTEMRGLAFDFGLLGDVEFDQGKIPDAVTAYQRMVNLRPDLQSYSRVAQVRWIMGDLPGAVEAMSMAAQAGSPLNAEPTAWTYSRLALLQLQLGDIAAAKHSAAVALQVQSNSAPAFQALGRIELADGETNAAVESLRHAAALNHLPESQWLLADALRLLGKTLEAAAMENQILERGVAEDPRSFSIYLATRGAKPDLALKLAQSELDVRGDVFTHDALAWALQANGRLAEARAEMAKALAEGTLDARLFVHAAVISAAGGHIEEAACFRRLAWDLRAMLFPSELELLGRLAPRGQSSQQHASNNRLTD
jgi:tetratricopeptide (TPR) repeat protein